MTSASGRRRQGSFNMFRQRTPGDYDFGECVSALQKTIRAGDPRQALYWAAEIEATGSKEATYLWNRLRVIASEDIGPTPEGNAVAILLPTLAENYSSAKSRKNDSWRLFLAHAILAMCSAPKTRICDNLVWAVYHQKERYDIPDNALDMHTPRGRRMGRGSQHWVENCMDVHPHTDAFQPLDGELEAEVLGIPDGVPWRYSSSWNESGDDINRQLF